MISDTDITVLTAALGTRDVLSDDQPKCNAHFKAATDCMANSNVWMQEPACGIFKSNRRNSRLPKILSHYYAETGYSIWIDAKVRLISPPGQVVHDLLGDSDMAIFRHPKRACTYEEADECARRELDDPLLIRKQMARYKASGLPPLFGLAECCIIIRRSCPSVDRFNMLWWSEYCLGSVRDQLSFMYAVWRTGIKYNFIPGSIYESRDFFVLRRPAQQEQI